jgi:tetratricopeptide (TPR) repeat protein
MPLVYRDLPLWVLRRLQLWLAMAAAGLFLFPVSKANAQGGIGSGPSNQVTDEITQAYHQGGSLQVTVLNEDKTKLDRQSVARLHCDNPLVTVYQTTKNGSQATFLGLSACKYSLEVSAAGYLSTQKEVEVAGLTDTLQVKVTLEKDPTAINLDAADAHDDLIPSKISKDITAAVAALKSSNLKEAKKHLDSAYQSAPESRRVNFLMGYLFFEQKDYDQAETYLNHAIALGPGDVQSLMLFGRVQLLRAQYEPAKACLERAVLANPNDWMTHNLLANVYLKLKNYEMAREQAQMAIDLGKQDANLARLVLGEAQTGLGHTAEAIQTLRSFLAIAPSSPQVPHVQEIITQLEQGASHIQSQYGNADSYVGESFEQLVKRIPELKTLQPAPSQELRPMILLRSGARVDSFFRDVVDLTAHEEITQEKLDAQGAIRTSRGAQYKYLVLLHRTDLSPRTEEYRTDLKGNRVEPGGLDEGYSVTAGFAFTCIHFLSSRQSESVFRYLGDESMDGRDTYAMAFAQLPGQATSMSFVSLEGASVPVFEQGVAWIDKNSFQIIRIRTDLLASVPLSLDRQTTEVKFTEAHLRDLASPLWLPSDVNLYVVFNGHVFRNKHHYSNYERFRVSSTIRTQ